MDRNKQDQATEDAYEPVDLGTVSEETRGGDERGIEHAVGPNSKLD